LKEDDDNQHLAYRVLNFTKSKNTSLWHRRCGVVPFVTCTNPKRSCQLPVNFVSRLIDACESSLLHSPKERFTQTGIAWTLRYILTNSNEQNRQEAFDMIVRHGPIWTTEAKKSLTEKLSISNSMRKTILSLK
jgi:DNA alkylation repair enzyme